MRGHNRQQQNQNNNPVFSTPMRVEHSLGRNPAGNAPHSAPLPSTVEHRLTAMYMQVKKRPALDPDYASDDTVHAEVAQPSPSSIIDPMDTDARVSPVDVTEEDVPASNSDKVDEEEGTSAMWEGVCFCKPRRSQTSRTMLASATNLMRDVYVHLVQRHRQVRRRSRSCHTMREYERLCTDMRCWLSRRRLRRCDAVRTMQSWRVQRRRHWLFVHSVCSRKHR